MNNHYLDNLSAILRSEFHGATAYLDRLTHALGQMSDLYSLKSVSAIAEQLEQDISEILETDVLPGLINHQFDKKNNGVFQLSNVNNYKKLQTIHRFLNQFFPPLFGLNLHSHKLTITTTEVINRVYESCFQLHQIIFELSELDVPFPRVNLVEVKESDDSFSYDDYDWDDSEEDFDYESLDDSSKSPIEEDSDNESEEYIISPPLFYLDANRVSEFVEQAKFKDRSYQLNYAGLSSLDGQREKKYDEYLSLGHKFVSQEDYEKALIHFEKAKSLFESAEILTLIGWVYSLQHQMDKAKTYCLQAIRKNPDYGPPYNDLGTYLLNQGEVEESLRWFDLAKKCPEYQNREFPFINSGRAHMAKKDYELALQEFTQAMRIAPYNEKLQETVEKLKKAISAGRLRQKLKDINNAPEDVERDHFPNDFL